MIKITFSEEVWINGEKVSEVTTTKETMNNITSYSDRMREFEKIVDSHNGDVMVNSYELTTNNTTNGETAVLAYYYGPAGLTILRGIAWERVED